MVAAEAGIGGPRQEKPQLMLLFRRCVLAQKFGAPPPRIGAEDGREIDHGPRTVR